MIEIKEVTDENCMRDFVKFPFEIYKGSPYWVPPIIDDEVASFDKTKNPVFEHADGRYFLAYQNGKIVGRVAALLNWQEIKDQGVKKIRFGWWDVVDDVNVTRLLLEKVAEIGRENNLEYMEGPMGFSNLDKVGVLTYGFDHIGTMITWYNHPYYSQHLESLGFVKEKEYLENKMLLENIDPETFRRPQELIKKRYKLKELNFTKTKDIFPYVDKMFDLFNESYSKLSSFVAITDVQKEYFKKKYISFINPEYIKFVEDENHNLVAFAIVMPSFSKALQKANGKLFPIGFLHLLKAKYFNDEVCFYLIGVHPSYQGKGVHAIIFNEYYNTVKAKGVITLIRTPELEENTAIASIWKDFKPVTHQRRRTYRKDL
ncbi:MAG: GNAT family N-acetyltransferase [Bacteroidota bacterium]